MRHVHSRQGSMDGRAAHLDGDDGVEDPNGSLEGLEVAVLVRKDTELVVRHAEADSGVHVLFRGLEPGIPLRLPENVVQQGVEGVVVHRVPSTSMDEKSVGWRTDAEDAGAGTLASRKGALAGLGAREALYIEDMAGRGERGE